MAKLIRIYINSIFHREFCVIYKSIFKNKGLFIINNTNNE